MLSWFWFFVREAVSGIMPKDYILLIIYNLHKINCIDIQKKMTGNEAMDVRIWTIGQVSCSISDIFGFSVPNTITISPFGGCEV
jgi:hypothetical protein